jgi:hypothetical protein
VFSPTYRNIYQGPQKLLSAGGLFKENDYQKLNSTKIMLLASTCKNTF